MTGFRAPRPSSKPSSLWTSPTAFGLLILYVVCSVPASATSRLSSRTITTRYGALKGLVISPDARTPDADPLPPVEAYLGVPYASAPTGAMRFMPPGTPQHWKGIRMADRFSPACPQRPPDISNETEALQRMPPHRLEHLRRLTSFLNGPEQQSEDCLYLNLYTPIVGESSTIPRLCDDD